MASIPERETWLVTLEPGEEEEKIGEIAGGVYLEQSVVGMSMVDGGTRLVTAAPGQDQVVAKPSTTTPAHHQHA